MRSRLDYFFAIFKEKDKGQGLTKTSKKPLKKHYLLFFYLLNVWLFWDQKGPDCWSATHLVCTSVRQSKLWRILWNIFTWKQVPVTSQCVEIWWRATKPLNLCLRSSMCLWAVNWVVSQSTCYDSTSKHNVSLRPFSLLLLVKKKISLLSVYIFSPITQRILKNVQWTVGLEA